MKFSDSGDESSTMAETRPHQEPPSKRSAVRVKKGVILSDDEEEEEEAPKPAPAKAAYKAKTKPRYPDLDTGAESELRAMMDIDDGRKTAVVALGAKKAYTVRSSRSSNEGLPRRRRHQLRVGNISASQRRGHGRPRIGTGPRARPGSGSQTSTQTEETGSRGSQRA